jgi:membrane associated rhomboid family serine protease
MSGYGAPPPNAETIPHCYRHPDRETYISCQRCRRPICPDCMRDASVGFQCPDCVREAAQTTPRTRTAFGGIAGGRNAIVTITLIAINVAVFIAARADGGTDGDVVKRLALIPDADFPRLGIEGVAQGSYWQLVTSTFLHTEPLHILMNMIGLWIFGSFLESQLGRWRYLALYLVTGFVGSVTIYLFTPGFDPAHPALNYSLGASGSVFGLFGAAILVLVKQRRDITPLLILVGFNLVYTFVGANISWQAHLGGLLSGLAIGAAYAYAPRQRRQLVAGVTLIGFVLVGVVLVALRTAQLTT